MIASAPSPSRRNGGFSLIELMFVMAILSLMAAMAGVSIDNFVPKERLNTAVRQLTERLRDARSEAISRSLQYYVEYDLDNHRYRRLTPFSLNGGIFIEGEDDDEDRFTTEWHNLPKGVLFDSVIVAGEEGRQGRMFARFDPRGSASGHLVVLKQPKFDNFYTIEVLALTGTFRFHRGVYEREPPTDSDFN